MSGSTYCDNKEKTHGRDTSWTLLEDGVELTRFVGRIQALRLFFPVSHCRDYGTHEVLRVGLKKDPLAAYVSAGCIAPLQSQ
jgi:hypothetical protein